MREGIILYISQLYKMGVRSFGLIMSEKLLMRLIYDGGEKRLQDFQ